MVTPLVAAALISAGASVTNTALGSIAQNSAHAKNKRMFNWQKAWEKEKMQNSIQWTYDDMKEAGINPLVAGQTGATSGGGAPSGGNVAPNPAMANFGSEMITSYNTLKQIEQRQEEIDNNKPVQESQTNLNNTTAVKEGIEAGLVTEKTEQDIKESNSRIAKNEMDTKEAQARQDLIKEQTENQQIQNAMDEVQKLVNTGKFGQALAYIDRLAQTGSNIVGVLNPIKGALLNKNKREVEEYIEQYENLKGNKITYKKRTSK